MTTRNEGGTPGGRRRATIRAVADAAGVSIGTVSNALNNPAMLAPATLARVQEAISSTGFIRSSAARSLATRRSEGVGLVVPDIRNSLFVEIARGAQHLARDKQLNLLLANSGFSLESQRADADHPDQQDQFLDSFAEARMSGILLATMRDPREGLARIRDYVEPVVVINYDSPDADWCTVLMDNEAVGRRAVAHLAEIGRRSVLFLSPDDVVQPIADRRRGIREEAAARGVTLDEYRTDDLWGESGRRAAAAVLAAWEPGDQPLALLCVTDALALGALEVLRSRPEMRVPEDVAVMGMDGNYHAGGSDWITLTSFDLPGYRMGEQAIELLLRELHDEDHHHERVLLPPELSPRGSTVANLRGSSPPAASDFESRRW
ncbi:MAG: LacI family DNA-binding transcriptional regulator [Naasia sp.]